MEATDSYFESPDKVLAPGDIFPAVPFPLLKYPLRTYRPDAKAQRSGHVQVFASEGSAKPGDIAHCTFQHLRAMLLSHGCEIDKVVEPSMSERRHLLVAPVETFSKSFSPELVERIRAGQQPNRLYLPAVHPFDKLEQCVDLRRILPVPAKYLVDAQSQRIATLSQTAKADLSAQLGVYFSGLAIYVQDVNCPYCQGQITLRDLQIASGTEDDSDYVS